MKREIPQTKYMSMEEETMKLKPMADNILLKQNEATETTVSGIILATTTKEKPAIYEVVAVGPKVSAVSAGDKVVVSKSVGIFLRNGIEQHQFQQFMILEIPRIPRKPLAKSGPMSAVRMIQRHGRILILPISGTA